MARNGDYYAIIDPESSEDEARFCVVHKRFWALRGCLFDGNIEDIELPDDAYEACEATFELPGTREEGIRKMEAAGFAILEVKDIPDPAFCERFPSRGCPIAWVSGSLRCLPDLAGNFLLRVKDEERPDRIDRLKELIRDQYGDVGPFIAVAGDLFPGEAPRSAPDRPAGSQDLRSLARIPGMTSQPARAELPRKGRRLGTFLAAEGLPC